MTSYLSNNDITPFNNIYFRIPTLNNIKQILINNLQSIKNDSITDKYKILNFNNEFNNLQEYETDYMKLKYYNINMSLDIINKYKDIETQNNFFYFYNKNINLQFKNYSISNIINGYKCIINNLLKPININMFRFNVNFLDTDNYPSILSMHEFLKINLQSQIDHVTKNISIIDFYLSKIENTPESYNELYNYIFFLRKFPLFRKMINKYLESHENNIYKQIINNNLDSKIQDHSITYFDPYLNFIEPNKLLHNIFTLIQDKHVINNIFFNLYDIEKKIIKNDIYETYISLDFLDYGINVDNKNIIIDSEKLYKKLKIIENTIDSDYNILICLYLKNNLVDANVLQNLSDENLQLIVSKLLINSYMLFNYLNLDQYKNIDELRKIYYVDMVTGINEFNIYLHMLNDTLLYIYISFCFCKEYVFYNYISINLTFLKHFLYIYKYFKNNLPIQFPMYMFLLCSNENIKIVYEYKNHYLLDFFVEYYDLIFKNTKKYLFKN